MRPKALLRIHILVLDEGGGHGGEHILHTFKCLLSLLRAFVDELHGAALIETLDGVVARFTNFEK